LPFKCISMSRKGLSKQTQVKLAELRSQLIQAGTQYSETAPQLLDTKADFSEEDEQMFSIVLSDALNEVDITSRYPSFFQKLLVNQEMRKAFLDDLDILVNSKIGGLESLPGEPAQNLDFMHTVHPVYTIELKPTDQWQVTWLQIAQHLERIFLSPSLSSEAVYRNDASHLEEFPFRLFQSTVDLGGENITAILDALQPLDDPEVLQLSLHIVKDELVPKTQPLHLVAHLQWGNTIDQRVLVDERGKARFADIQIAEIIDPDDPQVKHDLRLKLENVD